MALKDNWIDLENAIEGVPDSGSGVNADDINKIAHAVIENEEKIGDTITEWQPNTEYKEGQLVCTKSIMSNAHISFYRCTVTHNSGQSIDTTKFTKVEPDFAEVSEVANTATADMYGNSIHETYATKAESFVEWQPNTEYKEGVRVWKDDNRGLDFLVCRQVHTSGDTIDYSKFITLQVYEANNAYNDIMGRRIDETYATKGEIEGVFDELHNYAQALISGGAV